MVLFLFIIMLLDIREEKSKDWNFLAVGGGVVVLFGFVVQLISVLGGYEDGKQKMVPFPEDLSHEDVKMIGTEIFTNYNFHLQVLGVLLLVATIGVVVLSRRQGKEGSENN
jgi:NADH-quinone oxidoreductase subunit J